MKQKDKLRTTKVLVLASRIAAGLDAYSDGLEPNSESDACFLIFQEYDSAIETARLVKAMISSQEPIEKMIVIARENSFED